jgi:hypothetical protein
MIHTNYWSPYYVYAIPVTRSSVEAKQVSLLSLPTLLSNDADRYILIIFPNKYIIAYYYMYHEKNKVK